MNLAAILGFCLLSLGSQSQSSVSTSPPQAAQTQSSEPAQSAPSATEPTPAQQKPNPTGQTSPSAKPTRRHKKATPSNCSNAPTALKPVGGSPTNATDPAGTTNAGSTQDPANSGSAEAGSAALKPCPPPKKVVRNGGSDEPTVRLTGGTTAEQAWQQSSTEQLRMATGENLKKIEGRSLNPSQQEMVSQINQFLEQSKKAVDAGDLERGHNLAMKAHLLSDELVKP